MKLILLFAIACAPIFADPRVPSSVNFVSGVPLNADEDPSGGFGDVAANLTMAVEFKVRYPSSVVRLIVTSLDVRRDRRVPTTNEILTTMVPSLDPARRYRVQRFRGVEIIFTEPRFSVPAQLQGSIGYESSPLPDLKPDDLAEIRLKIPQAELAVQLSANANPAQILPALAPLAISVGEFRSADSLVSGWLGQGPQASSELLLNAGVGTLGIYLVQPKSSRSHRRVLLDSLGIKSDGNVLFAYSKLDKASQLYIDALTIALKDDTRKFQLVVRNRNKLNLSRLPQGVAVIDGELLPHDVIEALVDSSVLSPLLCGDVSQSLGISYASGTKSLVFEVPEWKQGHLAELKAILGKGASEVFRNYLDAIFLVDEDIANLHRSSAEWKTRAVGLAQALVLKPFNEHLVYELTKRSGDWDLLSNLLQVHDFLRRLDFTVLKEPTTAMLNVGALNYVKKGARGASKEFKWVALDKAATAEERAYALWILLNQATALDEPLWKAAADSLVEHSSPYFNPWTVLSPRTKRSEWAFLNSTLNRRFLAGELSNFQFLRAKVGLPTEVIQAEVEKINYFGAFKKYATHPEMRSVPVRVGRHTLSSWTDAINREALLQKIWEIDPEQFYEASAWEMARRLTKEKLLQIFSIHNRHLTSFETLTESSASNLLKVIRLTFNEWQKSPSYAGWDVPLTEAVEALKGLPPSLVGLKFIEAIIHTKSEYGDSRARACEVAAVYYSSTSVISKKSLPLLLGICISEIPSNHPAYQTLLRLVDERLPQDLLLWQGMVLAMDEDGLELWGAERIATLLASYADNDVSLLTPVISRLDKASQLRFRGFPEQAKSLVATMSLNPCLAMLLTKSRDNGDE